LDELTLSYLESLSTGELIELADKRGLDIPRDLERVFIIEELFYFDHDAEDTHHDIDHDIDHNEKFREFTVLPRQYPVSCIEVFIRDPLWAFVFWEIKPYDRKRYETSEDFEGYCLRVIPFKGDPLKEGDLKPDMAASFIVAVDNDDNARYLGFPPDDGRYFKVELCVLKYGDLEALAESPPFMLPYLVKPNPGFPSIEFIQAVYRNPLAVLSGVDHFSLVRSEDRLLRPRGMER
jgi:hypothetical protein